MPAGVRAGRVVIDTVALGRAVKEDGRDAIKEVSAHLRTPPAAGAHSSRRLCSDRGIPWLALQLRDVGRLARHVARVDGERLTGGRGGR